MIPAAGEAAASSLEPEIDSDGFPHAREVGTVARIGLALCYLACATVPWTAVRAGGTLRIGDIFLLLAVIFLVAADLDHRMPRFPEWVQFFILMVLVVGIIHEILPTSTAYLNARETITGITVTRGQDVADSNLSVLIRFAIAIIGLPLIFIRARFFDSRALVRCAIAFTIGASISGLIAFTDSRGLTHLAHQITGLGSERGRSVGLTEDANYVAMGCVFSLPFVLWKLVSDVPRERLWAAGGLVALALGVYGSGSRSGGGAAVVAILVPIVLLPQYRRSYPVVALVLGIILAGAFVADPGLGHSVLKGLRLTNDQGAGSDLARSIVNQQAERDFIRSPIYGVGLKVAGEAHIVYLQALAAGGILLLLGLAFFLLGAMTRCLRRARFDGFAAALFASILAGAIFNAAQNALTIRIVYLPAALAAALPVAAARSRWQPRSDTHP